MNHVSRQKLSIFATVLLFWGASASGTTTVPFTPQRYVQFNKIIVEGVFISDEEVPIENRIVNSTGWIYPTNWACVVVDSLLQQTEETSYATGDTICFRYTTSYKSYNPDKPGLTEGIVWGDEPLRASIGQHGLYAFHFMKDGECRRSSWFAIDDSRVSGIYDVLNKLAADSNELGE
jgi:hypothetical protein